MWIKIAIVSVVCLLINIPMGMMRERCKKFTLPWIFWVHASIPLIIFLRLYLKLHLIAIPINIVSAILGQCIGGAPEKKKRRAASPTAS